MKGLQSDKSEWPTLAVYDIEATEWVNITIIGHVDELGNRLTFDNMDQYLSWLFSPAFGGDHVWAHWGGHYDHRFVIAYATKKGWSWQTIQSGNLLIIIKVIHPSGRTIKFCESARLMPDSVEKIGKTVKLHKLDVDRTHMEKLTREETIEYCLRDCDIVLLGLQYMRRTLDSVNADFAYTLASIATRWVRRSDVLDWLRFYSRNEDNRLAYDKNMELADEFCLPAYYGGRVEVFKTGTFNRPLYYYDITSSYPWSMLHPIPTYFEDFRPSTKNIIYSLECSGVSDATVHIDPGTLHIPILPFRFKGKLIFPEGTFRSRWPNIELLELWKRNNTGSNAGNSGRSNGGSRGSTPDTRRRTNSHLQESGNNSKKEPDNGSSGYGSSKTMVGGKNSGRTHILSSLFDSGTENGNETSNNSSRYSGERIRNIDGKPSPNPSPSGVYIKNSKTQPISISISAQCKFRELAFLKPFVDTFYNLRFQAKEEGDEFRSYTYKILLNSLYGKLVESVERKSILHGTDLVEEAIEQYGAHHLQQTAIKGIYSLVTEETGPFRHVPAGTYVTARSRLRLLEGMEECLRCGANVYYCDTDSIVTDKRIPKFDEGKKNELGTFKLEEEIVEAEFVASKVYRYRTKGGKEVYKVKGMPIKGLTEDEKRIRWDMYNYNTNAVSRARIDGRGFNDEQKRNYSSKEGIGGFNSDLNKGVIEPHKQVLQRQLINKDGKRMHYGDGESRPLRVVGEDVE